MTNARKVKLGAVVKNADGTRTYRVMVGREQHGRVTVGATYMGDGTVFLTDEEAHAARKLALAAFREGR